MRKKEKIGREMKDGGKRRMSDIKRTFPVCLPSH